MLGGSLPKIPFVGKVRLTASVGLQLLSWPKGFFSLQACRSCLTRYLDMSKLPTNPPSVGRFLLHRLSRGVQ